MKSDYVVSYLKRVSPDRLEKLKKAFPSSEEMFTSKQIFGADEAVAGERSARLALIREAAGSLQPDIDGLIQTMRHRSRRVSRLRLAGGLVAALAGALGAVAALVVGQMGLPKESIAITGSLTAMVGGLLTVFANHFERSESGEKYTALETLPKLVEARSTVARSMLSVERDSAFPLSDADITQTLKLLDDSAIEVMRLKYLAA
ncbi:hypothetical protein [Lysobacter terrae]